MQSALTSKKPKRFYLSNQGLGPYREPVFPNCAARTYPGPATTSITTYEVEMLSLSRSGTPVAVLPRACRRMTPNHALERTHISVVGMRVSVSVCQRFRAARVSRAGDTLSQLGCSTDSLDLNRSRMPSLDIRIPPPVVGALVAAAMWGVSMLGPQLALAPGPRYTSVAILVAAGVAFDVLGLLAFRGAGTTINPLRPERASSLVTGGIYRITRNPMYVGVGLLLLAWAAYLSALLPFAGPALFALYITRFQIQPEERVLKGIFGEDYAAYCARVRRWL